MLTGQALGAAISSAIEKKGVSQAALARHFGLKPPSIQDWIKRGTIGKERLPVLWEFFADVVGPEHWGLASFPGREAAEESPQLSTVVGAVAAVVPPGYVRLQHLSPIPTMGDGGAIDEPIEIVRHLDVLERWVRQRVGTTHPDRLKVLTARGRSMAPTINDQDIVFVDVGQRSIQEPGIYVIDVAGRLLLKKALIQSTGVLILRSDNVHEYPDEERHDLTKVADTIHVSGRVLAWWALRNG